MNVEYEKRLINLGIPFIDLHALDSSFCEEICVSLDEFFRLYPHLSKSLCAVGTFDSVMNFALEHLFLDSTDYILQNETDKEILDFKNDCLGNMNFGYYSDFTETEFWYHNNNSNMAFYRLIPAMDKKDVFTAIFFSTPLYKENEKFLNTVTTVEKIRHVFWHELAHFLDSFLKVSESVEFMQLSSEHSLDKLLNLDYLKTSKEAFAELFSLSRDSYCEMPLLFEKLQKIISNQYQRFVSQNSTDGVFDYSRFDFTSKFLIDEKKKRY